MIDGTSTPTAEQRLAQLARLRDLWLENRSTRQFVQIAEELRRLGDAEAAASLLETGLESHPRYLSAQVALARCRVELGQAEAARGLLESVVEIDSTHPLATRLLVEAYVGVGNAAAAREKLELYRLLNAGDPQIERLEEDVRGLEGSPLAVAAAEHPKGGEAALLYGAPAAESEPHKVAGARDPVETESAATDLEGGEPQATAVVAPEPGLAAPFELVAGAPRAAVGSWARSRGLAAPFAWAPMPAPGPPASRGERGLEPPFGVGAAVLGGGAATTEGGAAAVGSAEIQPAGARAERAAPWEPDGRLEATTRAGVDLESLPEARTSPQAIADLLVQPVAEERPSVDATALLDQTEEVDAREAQMAAELADTSVEDATLAEVGVEHEEPAAEPNEAGSPDATELASEPLPEAPTLGHDDGPSPQGISDAEVGGEPSAPTALPFVAVVAAPTAGPLAAAEVPNAALPSSLPAETTTLGQLYLRQGHSAEAERIFRRVLEREPANDTAREGLRQAMIATDLSRAGAAAPPRGITERKIHRLTGWVSRLRRT